MQQREDVAAAAYRDQMKLMAEYQQMLTQKEDAQTFLREEPRRSGHLEAEVEAGKARLSCLVRQLPGTPEEIQARLEVRGALLEGSSTPAPSSHDARQ